MPYSKEIIDKAMQTVYERRTEAELEGERRLEEIRERFPDIYEHEMNTKSTVLKLIGSAIGGGVSDSELLEKIEKSRVESIDYVRSRLKECGLPEDYLDVPYTCKKCYDRGSIEGKSCDCFKSLLKQYASAQLTKSGKLKDFSQIRTDVYESPEVTKEMCALIEYLKRYCRSFDGEEPNRSLLLFGSTGTGKTFLSACLAGELAGKGYAVCFGTAYEFFKAIEDQRFKNAEGDTESTLLGCDLLIIDDLGCEFRTSFTESVLYNIINTRLDNARPTIVSTNLTIDELKKRYNERIASRLTGMFMPIKFKGRDVRLNLQRKSI